MTEYTERYSRNIGLFGDEGQRKISACRVGIIGLGGLGSHVVQQLACLGVVTFVLVDDDMVTLSSLNRLVGAVVSDVDKSTKVDVAQRVIRSIQPSAVVMPFIAKESDREARLALESVDIIFGCLDNDLARLSLTEFAARNRKPYIDLASDTGNDNGVWFGGRLLFAFDGSKCLSCAQELDRREIARAGMTPEQRVEDQRIYGVPLKSLAKFGPAVISINGVLASLGVTEFMVWATGIRKPHSNLSYRGDLGRITINKDNSPPGCYYCSMYLG